MNQKMTDIVEYWTYRPSEVEAAKLAISAIEKQIPNKPIHIHIEHDKHDWKKNADGTIDEFAFEEEFHSGVVCERCHEFVCILCHEDYDDFAGKCIIDNYICPSCNNVVREKDMYCNHCGQALDWGD